jgi:hypothetical protein
MVKDEDMVEMEEIANMGKEAMVVMVEMGLKVVVKEDVEAQVLQVIVKTVKMAINYENY